MSKADSFTVARLAADPVALANRDRRYGLREFLWQRSSLRRVASCGRKLAPASTGVSVVLREGRAHYAGLQLCGSVHACPVCAAKIRDHRAGELRDAMIRHRSVGGGLFFGTFTVPHSYGDRLAPMLDVVLRSFRGIQQGRVWQATKRRWGIVGMVRAVEVNNGANGWHPHVHFLLFTDRHLETEEAGELERFMVKRWVEAVEHRGLPSPRFWAQDFQQVEALEDAARYLVKGFAFELTRHDVKSSKRAGGRNPFQVLEDAALGCVESAALWREYERATKGRQAITWSKGLKKRLRVGELDDEAIVEAKVGGDLVLTIDPPVWRRVARERGACVRVLRAAETGGAAACLAALERFRT